MQVIGEVHRRGALRHRYHARLRGQHIDMVVDGRMLELLPRRILVRDRVVGIVLPRQQLAQPGDLLVVALAGRELPAVALAAGFLVAPVRRHAVFGEVVHLLRADLHLERAAIVADDHRVQGLVAVGLRPRDVVVELARNRLPDMVDDAEDRVAILDVVHDHAERAHIVQIGEIEFLAAHLLPDAVDVLGPAGDLGGDAGRGQFRLQPLDRLRDIALALDPLLV
ncbi:hypothetical protein D3C86_1567780 [compost metagenome]